jgi:hypothetical protein
MRRPVIMSNMCIWRQQNEKAQVPKHIIMNAAELVSVQLDLSKQFKFYSFIIYYFLLHVHIHI